MRFWPALARQGLLGASLALVLQSNAIAQKAPDATANQSAADFYAGRRISLVVDSPAGGGYDTYGRVFARFYGNHLPGSPTIVVQNMPGAGGLVATNWLAEIAPRDGATIEILSRSIPLAPLMGISAARFDPLQLSWLGSLNRELVVIFSWHSSGFDRFQDLQARQANIGVTGGTSDSMLWTRLINNLLGGKLNIITGYPGSDAVNLAIERGETNTATGSWSSLKARKPEWLRDRKINILAQFAMTRHPELPDVPVLAELIPDQETRDVFDLFLAPQEMGRPFAAPPGVPAERLAILRKAFMATAADPEFLKAAKGAGIDIDPVSGERMTEILRRVYAMPASVVARARAASQADPGAAKK